MVTIQYPTSLPTHTVDLRSPMLGDSFTDGFKTNIHVTMSGSVVSTKRSNIAQRLMLKFTDIPIRCETQVSDLDMFLAYVRGRDVRLTLYGGDSWVGKITTNPLEVETIADDRAEFIIELIGMKTPTKRLLKLEHEVGYLLLEDYNYLLLEEDTP